MLLQIGLFATDAGQFFGFGDISLGLAPGCVMIRLLSIRGQVDKVDVLVA